MYLAHASPSHSNSDPTDDSHDDQVSGAGTQTLQIYGEEPEKTTDPLQAAGIFFVIVLLVYVVVKRFFPESRQDK